MPERPYTQYNQYIETSYPTLGAMKELHQKGKLNAAQSLFMAARKPDVELYDLEKDPHEIQNLASSPAHRKVVKDLGGRLDAWLKEIDDKGAMAENAAAREL